MKILLTEQISNTIPDSNQPFYAMCDAFNFGTGAAISQSHQGTKKKNLLSANSESNSKHQECYLQTTNPLFFSLHKNLILTIEQIN